MKKYILLIVLILANTNVLAKEVIVCEWINSSPASNTEGRCFDGSKYQSTTLFKLYKDDWHIVSSSATPIKRNEAYYSNQYIVYLEK